MSLLNESSGPEAAANAGEGEFECKPWRYRLITRKTEEYLLDDMNAAGAQGWEVVNVLQHRDPRSASDTNVVWSAFLKRPGLAGGAEPAAADHAAATGADAHRSQADSSAAASMKGVSPLAQAEHGAASIGGLSPHPKLMPGPDVDDDDDFRLAPLDAPAGQPPGPEPTVTMPPLPAAPRPSGPPLDMGASDAANLLEDVAVLEDVEIIYEDKASTS